MYAECILKVIAGRYLCDAVKVQNVQNGLLVYDPMLIPLTTQILPL